MLQDIFREVKEGDECTSRQRKYWQARGSRCSFTCSQTLCRSFPSVRKQGTRGPITWSCPFIRQQSCKCKRGTSTAFLQQRLTGRLPCCVLQSQCQDIITCSQNNAHAYQPPAVSQGEGMCHQSNQDYYKKLSFQQEGSLQVASQRFICQYQPTLINADQGDNEVRRSVSAFQQRTVFIAYYPILKIRRGMFGQLYG